MNRGIVAQASRLRVPAASRRLDESGAGRPRNPQARTPALRSGAQGAIEVRSILTLALSLRERAGVRGNLTPTVSHGWTIPRTVKLAQRGFRMQLLRLVSPVTDIAVRKPLVVKAAALPSVISKLPVKT
jgi:hypothetical protein